MRINHRGSRPFTPPVRETESDELEELVFRLPMTPIPTHWTTEARYSPEFWARIRAQINEFTWQDSPQGATFWSTVDTQLRHNQRSVMQAREQMAANPSPVPVEAPAPRPARTATRQARDAAFTNISIGSHGPTDRFFAWAPGENAPAPPPAPPMTRQQMEAREAQQLEMNRLLSSLRSSTNGT